MELGRNGSLRTQDWKTLFPQPQEILGGDRLLPLMARGAAACAIVIGEGASEAEQQAARTLQQALEFDGRMPAVLPASRYQAGQKAIVLGTPESGLVGVKRIAPIEVPCNADQAYTIEAGGDGVFVVANQPIGVQYAVRTLCQLLETGREGVFLPEVTIRDWPDMAYRGIYVECRWGPDMMTLDDWRRAIDYLADLKLNVMSVGVHNNWWAQYDKLSEFLLLPSRAYPFLNQPKSIDYYSPRAKEWKHLEYLPAMVTGDFFGDVIAYGRRKGVLVRPHFNSPGHNTIIPRLIPETSARDEAGRPTHFGFCLTNPKTYEVMFTILDEIVDTYLAPNGVDWIHLGLDEVYPARSIDESDLSRVVSPYCQCPACRQAPWEDHFVDYVVALCQHLQAKGIRHIGMWHDSFLRGGRLNQALADRFEREGLKDAVIIHWWKYNDYYDDIHPELGLSRWVVPQVGYFYWVSYIDHLSNIDLALRRGHAQGAAGTEAYGLFNRCFDRQYHCLADSAWNRDATPRLAEFREKYVKKLYGSRWAEVSEAFRHFDQAVQSQYQNLVNALFYYTYAYGFTEESAYIRDNFPQAILAQLLENPLLIRGRLQEIRQEVARARAIWRDVPARDAAQAELAGILDLEAQRIEVVTDIYLRLVDLLKAYRRQQRAGLGNRQAASQELGRAAGEVAGLLAGLDALMARTEQQPDSYLAPQSLRELSLIRRFLTALGGELGGIKARAEAGGPPVLPDLEVMARVPVNWPD